MSSALLPQTGRLVRNVSEPPLLIYFSANRLLLLDELRSES